MAINQPFALLIVAGGDVIAHRRMLTVKGQAPVSILLAQRLKLLLSLVVALGPAFQPGGVVPGCSAGEPNGKAFKAP
jgi:hypothetical protein